MGLEDSCFRHAEILLYVGLNFRVAVAVSAMVVLHRFALS